jgi:Retinal pigment epithelial membrane protein
MVTRRETIGLLGAGAATLSLNRQALGESPDSLPLPAEQRWLTRLSDGIADGIDSAPTIEGTVPPELSGTLYRNGPGLFERNGYRKATLLDGDGMIRAFTFAGGKVRFRTRFVTTEKLTREASGLVAAGLGSSKHRRLLHRSHRLAQQSLHRLLQNNLSWCWQCRRIRILPGRDRRHYPLASPFFELSCP